MQKSNEQMEQKANPLAPQRQTLCCFPIVLSRSSPERTTKAHFTQLIPAV